MSVPNSNRKQSYIKPRHSPRNSPRHSHRNSLRHSPRHSSRNSPRNSPRKSPRHSPRNSPRQRAPLHPYGAPNRWHTGGVVSEENVRNIRTWFHALIQEPILRGRAALLRALDITEPPPKTWKEIKKIVLDRLRKTVHPDKLLFDATLNANDLSILYYVYVLVLVYTVINDALNDESFEKTINVHLLAKLEGSADAQVQKAKVAWFRDNIHKYDKDTSQIMQNEINEYDRDENGRPQQAQEEEARRRAREAAAQEEARRQAREAERRAREAAAQEEAQRQAREAAAQEEARRKAREAAAQEEARRQAREAERRAREAAAQEEAQRKAREAAAQEEARRKAREAAAQEEARRQAREAAAQEEAQRRAREEAQRREREAAERQRQETIRLEILRQEAEIARLEEQVQMGIGKFEGPLIALMRLNLERDNDILSRMSEEDGNRRNYDGRIQLQTDALSFALVDPALRTIVNPWYSHVPGSLGDKKCQESVAFETLKADLIRKEVLARKGRINMLRNAGPDLPVASLSGDDETVASAKRTRQTQMRQFIEQMQYLNYGTGSPAATLLAMVPEPCRGWQNWWKGPPGVNYTAGGWLFEDGMWREPFEGWRNGKRGKGVVWVHDYPTIHPPTSPGYWYWDHRSNRWRDWYTNR